MEPEAYDELRDLEPNHWWYRGMRVITDRLLTRHLVKPGNLQILDAGCGAGRNLIALAVFGSVQGFDYSMRALRYASLSCRGRLAQASVERLPYRSDSFDLVTSFDVLYCREVGNDQRALAELARVVRLGGHLLIRLPALPILRGPHDAVVHGTRRYTALELRQKVAHTGLTPIRITYLNSALMPLIFLIRQFQNIRVCFGAAPRSDVKATPRLINTLLFNILKLEAFWIGMGRNFSAGVSVICLATKPLPSTLSLSSSSTRQARSQYPKDSYEELSV